MARAVDLALKGRGSTAPNPCVGAVLVHHGVVAAEGFHTACGKPHAEPEAIADARQRNVNPGDCVLYVTLEPCNHQGKTPPCTRAILNAGIRKVVVGCLDPNPDVAGGGAKFLRDHGVEVRTGVLEERCRDLIDDFLVWKTKQRTYNFLKMASTLDGRIAARHGRPEPVSSPESFKRVHEMRALAHAVVVGGGTLRADNPSLTCRMEGRDPDAPQPWAVVATTRLPEADAPLTLLTERADRTVFWTGEDAAASPEAEALRALGCRVWGLPLADAAGARLDLSQGFQRLQSELGCWYALCEGGGTMAGSLLDAGLADEFTLFMAPRVLGDEHGRPLCAGRNADSMAEALDLRLTACGASGPDLMLTFKPLTRS